MPKSVYFSKAFPPSMLFRRRIDCQFGNYNHCMQVSSSLTRILRPEELEGVNGVFAMQCQSAVKRGIGKSVLAK